MATVTLRPNGSSVPSGATGPSISNGTSYHGVTSDNGLSYITFPDSGYYYAVDIAFDTSVIPATADIRSVTPRVRHNYNWSALDLNNAFIVTTNGLEFARESINYAAGVFTTQTGTTRTAQPNGAAWSQSAIDGLGIRVFKQLTAVYTPAFSVDELYLDVVYNVAPVATGNALGSVGTSRPTFTWGYSDTEGEPQERYRVKVFSAAQYGAGGFDPNTAVPVVDSGEIYSAATSWTCSVDLTNATTYRAFIAVSDSGSNGRYSAITAAGPYSSATISLTAPNAPSLTATTDLANSRVTLAISATNNINPATTYRFEVERSSDGGSTWTVLKRLWSIANSTVAYASADFATTASPSITLYDYEAVRSSVAPRYRVRVKAVKAGNSLVSAYSTIATATAVIPASGWKLRSVTTPTVSVTLNVHSDSLSWVSEQRQSVFTPLGRSKAVVLSDVVGGESVDMELAFLSDSDYAAFDALRSLNSTLLLQSSYGDHRYVRLGASRTATHVLNNGGTRKYVVSTSFIEVDS